MIWSNLHADEHTSVKPTVKIHIQYFKNSHSISHIGKYAV